MKPILTAITVALLALTVGIHSADAKGKGGGGGAKAPAKPPAKKENAVDSYLRAHDTNKNGYIEATEFAGSKDDFKKWDKNVDGHLDHGELTAMLKK